MRIRQIVFIVLAAVLLAGCGRLKDIAVTSCALDSLTPRGFRGLDAELLVGINNPALESGVSKAFTLKKIPLSKFMSDDKEPRQYDKI